VQPDQRETAHAVGNMVTVEEDDDVDGLAGVRECHGEAPHRAVEIPVAGTVRVWAAVGLDAVDGAHPVGVGEQERGTRRLVMKGRPGEGAERLERPPCLRPHARERPEQPGRREVRREGRGDQDLVRRGAARQALVEEIVPTLGNVSERRLGAEPGTGARLRGGVDHANLLDREHSGGASA
jgi:hypothetical protein